MNESGIPTQEMPPAGVYIVVGRGLHGWVFPVGWKNIINIAKNAQTFQCYIREIMFYVMDRTLTHRLLKRSPLLSVMIDANIQYLEIFSAQPTQTGLARHFKGHETYTKAKKILVFSKPFSSSVRGWACWPTPILWVVGQRGQCNVAQLNYDHTWFGPWCDFHVWFVALRCRAWNSF